VARVLERPRTNVEDKRNNQIWTTKSVPGREQEEVGVDRLASQQIVFVEVEL